MKTYIALLKGINVGGHKKVPMAELRNVLDKSGFQNVKTYIQSGNVIFISPNQTENIEIAEIIEKSILERFGFDVPVIVRSAKEWQQSVKNNPFYLEKEVDISKLHLTILKEFPTTENHQINIQILSK